MQKIKVKKIERKRLAKELEAFLIFRYYPDLRVHEYIVCLNYDFKTNTYITGDIISRLDEAYQRFNKIINDIYSKHFELKQRNLELQNETQKNTNEEEIQTC